ncbi:hypothetical protein FISHEDRAFT_72686 [Fistulina hepatica ATCC 64428]|nr:hypothetical protein FISHEDRAFT_72686 [Fistulina hepatica ATCC 64428]
MPSELDNALNPDAVHSGYHHSSPYEPPIRPNYAGSSSCSSEYQGNRQTSTDISTSPGALYPPRGDIDGISQPTSPTCSHRALYYQQCLGADVQDRGFEHEHDSVNGSSNCCTSLDPYYQASHDGIECDGVQGTFIHFPDFSELEYANPLSYSLPPSSVTSANPHYNHARRSETPSVWLPQSVDAATPGSFNACAPMQSTTQSRSLRNADVILPSTWQDVGPEEFEPTPRKLEHIPEARLRAVEAELAAQRIQSAEFQSKMLQLTRAMMASLGEMQSVVSQQLGTGPFASNGQIVMPPPAGLIEGHPPSPVSLPGTPSAESAHPRKRRRLTADSPLSTKRVNSHDKRIFTIQHAMRAQILLCMGVDVNVHDLPDSYASDEPLPPDSPIRFVWEQPSSWSAHNVAMRKRVISQLLSNRTTLYRNVPEEQWDPPDGLEPIFEQAFTTFRERYRMQRNPQAREKTKERNQEKYARKRRADRKKIKLAGRSEARSRAGLDGPEFDDAITLECLSSEVSDSSDEETLVFRRPAWRSRRASAFFSLLDQHRQSQTAKRNQRSKRVERLAEDGCPPPNVARWIVSKAWMARQPEAELAKLALRDVEPELLFALGEESDCDT